MIRELEAVPHVGPRPPRSRVDSHDARNDEAFQQEFLAFGGSDQEYFGTYRGSFDLTREPIASNTMPKLQYFGGVAVGNSSNLTLISFGGVDRDGGGYADLNDVHTSNDFGVSWQKQSDLPGLCSDTVGVGTSTGKVVAIGCDGLSASTASAVSTDRGGSWIPTSTTVKALVRSYWPPRRGSQLVALPDDSIVLCGGKETKGDTVSLSNGLGIHS